MATVQDVIDRVQPLIQQVFQSAKPAAFIVKDACVWMKDAFDMVGSRMRTPTSSQVIQGRSGIRRYDLPNDILHGFEGIISMDYGNYPMTPWSIEGLKGVFHETWYNPYIAESNNGVAYYAYEDNEQMFSVFGTPGIAGATDGTGYVLPAGTIPAPTTTQILNFTLRYVRVIRQPDDFTFPIPIELERFIPIFPLYIIGRAFEKDDVTKGAAFIAEFEARLKIERIEKKRRLGKRVAPEAYTQGINNYNRAYSLRNRRSMGKPSW